MPPPQTHQGGQFYGVPPGSVNQAQYGAVPDAFGGGPVSGGSFGAAAMPGMGPPGSQPGIYKNVFMHIYIYIYICVFV